MARICRKCLSKESKSNPFVSKREYLCKRCQSIYDKKREKGYYKKRRKLLRRQYYLEHAEEQRSQKRLWRREFKAKDPKKYRKYNRIKAKKHREKKKTENFELFRKKQNLYCRRSNKKHHTKRIQYYRNLYQSNTKYRIGKLLRGRIRIALKSSKKLMRTVDLLGCSIEQLKTHLQQTAITNGYKNFDINNYESTKYHIDHIIPCASFDLTTIEGQKACFNYKNLQILEKSENRRKWKFIK